MGDSSSNSNKGLWGCIGAVLAAIITGTVTLIVADKLPPFSSQPTAVPGATVAATFEPTSSSTIVIKNQLVLPVNISIDGRERGKVDADTTLAFSIDSIPVEVRFEVVKQTDTSGNPVGDDVAGIFRNVGNDQTLVISNKIGGQFYFFPIIENNTEQDCAISINDGYVNERRPGVVGAHKIGEAGYYKYFSDSNVTLYCGESEAMYWWGVHPQGDRETLLHVKSGSGLLELILNP